MIGAGLRARLLLLIAAAFLPCIALVIYTAAEQRRKDVNDSTAEALRFARLLALSQERQQESAYHLLLVLSELPAARALDGPKVESLVRGILRRSPSFSNIGLANLSGLVIANATGTTGPVYVADRRAFRKAIQNRGFADGGFMVSRSTGVPAYQYGHVVLGPSDEPVGELFVNADVNWLANCAEQFGAPRDAVITVMDSSGTILMRTSDPARWSGVSVQSGLPDGQNIYRHMVEQGTGVGNAVGLDGVQRCYGFSKVKGRGNTEATYLVYSIKTSNAMFAAHQRLLRNLLLILGVTLAALFAAWLGTDRLVLRPVQRLLEASGRIERGELSARVGLGKGRNELMRLGSAFDDMAGALERRQDELRESRQLFQLFMDKNPAVAYVVDSKGQIVYANRQMEKIFGLERSSGEGTGRRVWNEGSLPREMRSDEPVILESGEPATVNCSIADSSGDTRHWVFQKFPITSREKLVGVIGVDVSEVEKAQAEVRRLNQKLERQVAQLLTSNKELESFSYSVSHDLRSPLRALDGFSHALEEDCGEMLNETALGHLARIKSASQKMSCLIDDLLELSRVARAEMKTKRVDLSALGREVIAELAGSCPERRLEVDVQPGMVVDGDPLLLSMLIKNLVENAWKFTVQETHAEITFGSVAGSSPTVFFIRDNGLGFDPEYADKLFRPFERLHSDPKISGTGIGLATVRRIVQRHGGRVWAEGKPDRGATFFFTLK